MRRTFVCVVYFWGAKESWQGLGERGNGHREQEEGELFTTFHFLLKTIHKAGQDPEV